jgi:UDP-N-acetylmuramyl pentapeptide phosphotransferase/UDP-N-acetylglucosamine-1-phosphate transferase
MGLGSLFLFFLFSVFFYYLLINKFFFVYSSKTHDVDFLKPQSFHLTPIPRTGGVVIILFSILYLFIFQKINIFSYSVILLGLFYFTLGVFSDIRINIKPEVRLLFMFFIPLIIIYFLNIKVSYTQLDFLDNFINSNKIFSSLFVCFCLIFVINGSNFIDGFNGLLIGQYLIILTILCLIIYKTANIDYIINFILLSILLGISFLIFNFPIAKVFLGDGGSYFLGTNLSLIIIEINRLKLNISPFFFACLLFYVFFEVFFSFFRKTLIEKTSPLKPDRQHLHMLFFKFINQKISNINKSNYLTSLVVNFLYFLVISPAILFYDNGAFCKFYFIVLIFFYLITYFILRRKIKIN